MTATARAFPPAGARSMWLSRQGQRGTATSLTAAYVPAPRSAVPGVGSRAAPAHPPPCIPYGKDWPDTGHWADIDGHVYTSDNPLPLRLRRGWDRVTGRAA